MWEVQQQLKTQWIHMRIISNNSLDYIKIIQPE